MLICPFCKRRGVRSFLKIWEPPLYSDCSLYAFVLRCEECRAFHNVRRDDVEAIEDVRFFIRNQIDLEWHPLTAAEEELV